MPPNGDTPGNPAEDDEDVDACLCGLEHGQDEVTSDEDLPPSIGGVEISANGPQNEGDAEDGCGLDFTTGEQTADTELPVAVGGA
jgi:hypothetical protein